MNSYMLYATVIPKLLWGIGLVGTCCCILLFTFYFMSIRNYKIFYGCCITTIIFICCFIAIIIILIIYGFSGSKCRTIINSKLEAKYDDYKILSNEDNILEDKFEFSSDNIRYEAYYDKKQNAMIVNKINSKEIDKIKNMF
jgi:uncharacterized membrane protein